MSANGQLTAAELVTVQGSMQLNVGAAAAWNAMKAAAAAAGVSITVAEPAGAYRSLALQQAMIANPAQYNVQPGVTLAPAGQSSHGDGSRVDVGTNNAWVVSHGASFGFVRDISGDNNHYAYTGASTGTPAQYLGETEMRVIHSSNGSIAVLGEFFTTVYTSASASNSFSWTSNTAAFGSWAEVTNDQFTTLVAEANARRAALIAEIAAAV